MSRTAVEVNAYSDGSRDAIESVIESLVDDGRSTWSGDELVAELRESLVTVEVGRQSMLARVDTAGPAERIAEALKLHAPNAQGDCPKCRCSCCDDPEVWPCPTARALGAKA
jgi:hypothetical protein